jgi:tripeptidyl-peptidase-1
VIDPVYPDTQPGGYNGSLMCGVYTPTNVISISYGIAERDQPANYLRRQCNEFMKLGLQGHTIFMASGDRGVAADPGDGGKIGCRGANQTIFNPETVG